MFIFEIEKGCKAKIIFKKQIVTRVDLLLKYDMTNYSKLRFIHDHGGDI